MDTRNNALHAQRSVIKEETNFCVRYCLTKKTSTTISRLPTFFLANPYNHHILGTYYVRLLGKPLLSEHCLAGMDSKRWTKSGMRPGKQSNSRSLQERCERPSGLYTLAYVRNFDSDNLSANWVRLEGLVTRKSESASYKLLV